MVEAESRRFEKYNDRFTGDHQWSKQRSMDTGEAVLGFLSVFAEAAQISPRDVAVVRFGDSADLADELASMILAGKKRAATYLARDFAQGRPPPRPGDLEVVLDGEKLPRCIIRVVQVDIKPLGAVDEQFAWDEGGGDRSLSWWRSAHARYFKRQAAREGFSLDKTTEVVLERFEVVWPPEVADAPLRPA